MKVFLVIIISFLFTNSMWAQDYPDSGFTNKVEAKNLMVNGLKEGKWAEYIVFVMHVKGDVGRGLDSNIFASDTVHFTKLYHEYSYTLTVYKNGKPFGIERKYFRNGVLKEQTHYSYGEKNGMEKSYYYDGKLFGFELYSNGKINGIATWYYHNGNIESEYPWTNGKINGIVKEYYEDKKLKKITSFKKGKEGKSKCYDEIGKLLKECQ